MKKDGYYVLVEGRQQTLDFIPTKHRFTLVLSDPTLIGKRRAAQRLMATTLSKLQQNVGNNDDPHNSTGAENEETTMMVERLLQESLEELTKDLPSQVSSG